MANCSLAFSWPMNSTSRLGRSFNSNELSSSSGVAETSRSGLLPLTGICIAYYRISPVGAVRRACVCMAAPGYTGISEPDRMPKTSGFSFRRPQQLASLLLLMLLAQCIWVIQHQTLTARDYEFARCGREMWEKPSPLAGYFTSCGNFHDGTLAYRAAALPLTIQRIAAGQGRETSTWEMRHELTHVLFLLHSAFLLTGIFLGGALWWGYPPALRKHRRLYRACPLLFFAAGDPRLHLSE